MPPTNPAMLLEHMDVAHIYAAVFFSDTRKWPYADPALLHGLGRAKLLAGDPAGAQAAYEALKAADPAAFPSERLEFGSDDPTLAAINSLTPLPR